MAKTIKSNNEWEILTDSGWQDFSGIQKVTKNKKVILQVKRQNEIRTLVCSEEHKLKLFNLKFRKAKFAEPGTRLFNGFIVEKQAIIDEESDFYDLLDVTNGHTYLTNDISSHNCAHIKENVVTELWLSVQPTLSAGGSAIIISTPNGDNNLFYRLWSEAIQGQNDFFTMELPWTVHPERDQAWFDRESKIIRAAKGEWGVQQEFFCAFHASGDTFIKAETILELQKNKQSPSSYFKDNQNIHIWRKPEEDKTYLLTSDIASGNADDFTTFCIVCRETGEVVADYKQKIQPQDYAPLLVEIATYYNKAMICVELNSYGLIVSEYLRAEKYSNLFYEKMTNINQKDYIPERNELSGISTTPTTRPDFLAKLDYMISTKAFQIYSARFLDELKNFVWINNKPQAKKGKNDDLVMTYAIACYLVFNSNTELQAETKELIKQDDLLAMLGGLSTTNKQLSLSDGGLKDINSSFEIPAFSVGTSKRETAPFENKQANPWDWLYN